MQQTSDAFVLSNVKQRASLKKSQFSTSQKTAADGDVKMPPKAHCVRHSKESVCNLSNFAFFM